VAIIYESALLDARRRYEELLRLACLLCGQRALEHTPTSHMFEPYTEDVHLVWDEPARD
jgi:hypothetical protein